MKGTFPVNKFRELETPFYYYDVNVLRETLSCINKEAGKYNNFCVHYAVKANANHKVLTITVSYTHLTLPTKLEV